MDREIYVRFMAKISGRTSGSLFRILDNACKNRVGRVNLMISSPGGTVFHGLSLYNYLSGAPFETITANFGFVGSAALMLYAAGRFRLATPHSRFLVYGTDLTLQSQTRLDQKALEEHIAGMKLDHLRLARILADVTGKPEAEVLEKVTSSTAMTAADAKEYGLVNEIRKELFPPGAELFTVSEVPEPAARGEGPLPPSMGASRD